MDLLYPPFHGTPVVQSIKRPHIPRSLRLLLALYPALVGSQETNTDWRSAYRMHSSRQLRLRTSKAPLPLTAAPSPRHPTESIFIDALVQAAICTNHANPRLYSHSLSNINCTYPKPRRRDVLEMGKHTARYIHHITNTRPAITRTSLSREEYLNLVDTYREFYHTQAQWMEPTPPPHFPMFLPSMPTAPVPLPVIGEVSERVMVGWPPDPPSVPEATQSELVELIRESPDDRQQVDIANLIRVLQDADCDHYDAFKAYSLLPAPGVSFLSEGQIRLLFRRLSTMKKKDPKAALRYMSVIDEMRSQNLPLVQAEWNSAIAFCGQCFARIGSREVEKALVLWKEMENEANVKSNNVTLNILFDIAAKAGKFVLAGMVLKEMESRGLEFNRFFRVANIYFNGLKGDGDGVRRAYGELVEAGEIVDTVVMNCVIASLISAGELASAENVYDRIKLLLSDHAGPLLPTSRTWQQDRELGRTLDSLVRSAQGGIMTTKDRARLQLLKSQITIVPNLHTFTIFIEHHASRTGDLNKICSVLAEMQSFGVAIDSRVFLKLFKGFSKHGRQPLTDWTLHRLQRVWSSLLTVIDEGKEDVRMGKWMVIWVVRAFHQCGGRELALKVWDELRAMQKPDREDLESTQAALFDILESNRSRPWDRR